MLHFTIKWQSWRQLVITMEEKTNKVTNRLKKSIQAAILSVLDAYDYGQLRIGPS